MSDGGFLNESFLCWVLWQCSWVELLHKIAEKVRLVIFCMQCDREFCSIWFTITSHLFQLSCKKLKVLLQLFLTKCPFKNQLKASQNHWYGTARTGPGLHYIDVSLCLWKKNTLSLRWVWLAEGCVCLWKDLGRKEEEVFSLWLWRELPHHSLSPLWFFSLRSI